MFGFMLDETEVHDDKPKASCKVCHLRLAARAPQVLVPDGVYHRDCYEAAQLKRTGQRPRLVRASSLGANGHTYRPAA
jgi:hypothetical protein